MGNTERSPLSKSKTGHFEDNDFGDAMRSRGAPPNIRKMKTMDRKDQTSSNHTKNHIKKNSSSGEQPDSANDYGYIVNV